MVRNIALILGLSVGAGSAGVLADPDRRAAFSHDPAFGLLLAWEDMLGKMRNAASPGHDPRRASLPQSLGPAPDPGLYPSPDADLRQIATKSPEMARYLQTELDRERNADWAKRRHQVQTATPEQGRLADIHTRGESDTDRYEDMGIWGLFGLSTIEKYRNAEAIGSALKRSAVKQKRATQGSGIQWKKARP